MSEPLYNAHCSECGIEHEIHVADDHPEFPTNWVVLRCDHVLSIVLGEAA